MTVNQHVHHFLPFLIATLSIGLAIGYFLGVRSSAILDSLVVLFILLLFAFAIYLDFITYAPRKLRKATTRLNTKKQL